METHELEHKGFKLTRQRRELLQVLTSTPFMLTAEDLHKRVLSQQPGVSLSTIYRNLELLVEEGLACKVDLGDGQARFEARRHHEHHHHLVCLACGKSEHLDCPMPELEQMLGGRGFRVTGHRFVVYGYCQACS